MDVKKAIKELSYKNTDYGGKCTQEVRKAAIRALEKQVPMKPKNTKTISDFSGRYRSIKGTCPICGEENLYKSNYYCDKCGQRLDWKGSGSDD